MTDEGKDVYVCIEPVEYGRRQYSPDATVEKDRLIKLPFGTPVDETIKTCFRRQGAKAPVAEDVTIMDKDAVIDSLHVPTVDSLRKKFEDNGFDYDKRWNLATLKEEFDAALKKKEESSNEK